MKEFTFVSICYNHEKYIIEHLESIKYQIINHGKGIKIHYILSDDCSKDNTVLLAKKWLSNNSYLFFSVEIIESDVNEGTVSNCIKSFKKVTTENFKSLAGDDLLYKNSIFELYDNDWDVIVTPIIRINGEQTIIKDLKSEYFLYMLCNNKMLTIVISKIIEFTMPFHTPGVFWKYHLFNDDLIKAIEEYRIIEDVPLFYYLFHKKVNKTSFVSNVYVLYRTNSGVSHNNNGKSVYDIEHDIIMEKYWKKSHKFVPFFMKIINEKVLFKLKRSKKTNREYLSEINKANSYYLSIKELAKRSTSIL